LTLLTLRHSCTTNAVPVTEAEISRPPDPQLEVLWVFHWAKSMKHRDFAYVPVPAVAKLQLVVGGVASAVVWLYEPFACGVAASVYE
jgi:hypothetical protein